MGKHSIGEFEEIVLLAILILEDDAYGVSIKQEIESRIKRNVSLGAMRSALDRLEDKGYLKSTFGEKTAERGGKRKKYFTVTSEGKTTITAVKTDREIMWAAIPKYQLEASHV
jgi:PadR family transcriptional regulator PadR